MCGIAGFIATDPNDPLPRERIDGMTDTLSHRGPDGRGIFCARGAAMGHRRLSIIDLSGGHQPLGNEDGTVQVVFNGEIYNFQELTRYLRSRGHIFRTVSDTECIVHLYEEVGDALVDKLRGMFAFAIWDTAKQRLLLGRDHLGKKPLYYRLSSRGLSFGSELKSVLRSFDGGVQPDLSAVEVYLAMGYVPAPLTAVAGVNKLEAGSCLSFDRVENSVRQWRFFNPVDIFSDPEAPPKPDKLLLAELDASLAEAVSVRLVSDVPIGAFLSGGLDSSAVVAYMVRSSEDRVRTFTIGFDEAHHDEASDAQLVAEHLGTLHSCSNVRADAVPVLAELVWHFDEPFADSSAVPTYYVCREARRLVTVALSGDGGDELFGGYRRYVSEENSWYFGMPPFLRSVVSGVGGFAPAGFPGKEFARYAASCDEERYIRRLEIFPAEERYRLLTPEARRRVGSDGRIERGLIDIMRRASHRPIEDRMMLLDYSYYLPDDIMVKVDRMSMAHGLETRAPFLDKSLVSKVGRWGKHLKIQRPETKVILRRVLEGQLPPETFAKSKHGFSAPVAEWLRGPLTPSLSRVGVSLAARGIIDPREVRRLVSEHLSGRRDHHARLFALLMLELWYGTYVDRTPTREAAVDTFRALLE
jgi:asparagine synthase (glutamine-hydrolysing)